MPELTDKTFDQWLAEGRSAQGSLGRRIEARRLTGVRHACDAITNYATGRLAGVRIVATGEFIDVALFESMAEAIAQHAHMRDVRDAFRAALELEKTNAAPAAERQ